MKYFLFTFTKNYNSYNDKTQVKSSMPQQEKKKNNKKNISDMVQISKFCTWKYNIQ